MQTAAKNAESSPLASDRVSVPKLWWGLGALGIFSATALALAAGIAANGPANCEAEGMLVIDSRPPFIAFATEYSEAEAARYARTQAAILRSSIVLEPALANPAIAQLPDIQSAEDPVAAVRERLTMELMPGADEVYLVKYRGATPESACAIVNAVMDQYMIYHQEDEMQRTNHVVSLLEQERQRRAVQVERLRRRLAESSKEEEPWAADSGATLSSAAEAKVSPEILKAKLFKLAAEQKGVEGEAAYLKQQVSDAKQSPPHRERGQQRLSDVEERLAGLKGKESFYLERLRAAQAVAAVGDGNEVEMEFARAELAREEKVFEMIAQRKLALQTEMRAPARVKFQRRAEVPK